MQDPHERAILVQQPWARGAAPLASALLRPGPGARGYSAPGGGGVVNKAAAAAGNTMACWARNQVHGGH